MFDVGILFEPSNIVIDCCECDVTFYSIRRVQFLQNWQIFSFNLYQAIGHYYSLSVSQAPFRWLISWHLILCSHDIEFFMCHLIDPHIDIMYQENTVCDLANASSILDTYMHFPSSVCLSPCISWCFSSWLHWQNQPCYCVYSVKYTAVYVCKKLRTSKLDEP